MVVKKYSTTWVENEIGLKKETFRYYLEKLKLLESDDKDNPNKFYIIHPNKYKEFTEAGIKRIWKIKLLRELGCSYDTIEKVLKDEYSSILDVLNHCSDNLKKNIKELEETLSMKKKLLEAVQSMKLLGIIPELYDLEDISMEKYLDDVIKNLNIFNAGITHEEYDLLEKMALNLDEINDDDSEKIDFYIKKRKNLELLKFNTLLLSLGLSNDLKIISPKIYSLVYMTCYYYCYSIDGLNPDEVNCINEVGKVLFQVLTEGIISRFFENLIDKEHIHFMTRSLAVYLTYDIEVSGSKGELYKKQIENYIKKIQFCFDEIDESYDLNDVQLLKNMIEKILTLNENDVELSRDEIKLVEKEEQE